MLYFIQLFFFNFTSDLFSINKYYKLKLPLVSYMNYQDQYPRINAQLRKNTTKSNSPNFQPIGKGDRSNKSPQTYLSSNNPMSRVNSGEKKQITVRSKSPNYNCYSKQQLIHLIRQKQSKINNYKSRLICNKQKMISLTELLAQYEQNQKDLSKDSRGNIQKLQDYIAKVTNDYASRRNELERQNIQIKKHMDIYKSCIRNLQIYGEGKDRQIKIYKQKEKIYQEQNRKIKEEFQMLINNHEELKRQYEQTYKQLSGKKLQFQAERQDYEKRINEKQVFIKKMAQFNNQICEKMIEEKNNINQIKENQLKYHTINNIIAIQQENQKLRKHNLILVQQNQIYRQKLNQIYYSPHLHADNHNQNYYHYQNLNHTPFSTHLFSANLVQSNIEAKYNVLKESECVLNTDRSNNTLRLQLNQQRKFDSYSHYASPDMNLTKPRFSYDQCQHNMKLNEEDHDVFRKQKSLKQLISSSIQSFQSIQQNSNDKRMRKLQLEQEIRQPNHQDWKSQGSIRKNGQIEWGKRNDNKNRHQDLNKAIIQKDQSLKELKDYMKIN